MEPHVACSGVVKPESLWQRLHPSPARTPQKARFEALRSRVFNEMAEGAGRHRLVWLLPFNLSVVALLAWRGNPGWRVAVQAIAIAVFALISLAQMNRPGRVVSALSPFVGLLCFMITLAVTGGLASPMLVSGMPILVGASVGLGSRPWMRPAFLALFVLAMMTLALVSSTRFGQLDGPLAPRNGWPSTEYLAVALGSTIYIGLAIYRIGCKISQGYERVACELAERREEICHESEDRTRALEGIAARLAHEVNNPLAAIKGLSVHMARHATDPKSAERLSIVAAEADRLQAIVDGFLSFSRGFDDLHVAPCKPLEMASELVQLMETRASESGLKLVAGGAADITLQADGRKIRQALLNLVLNAMQATPRGKSVTIEVGRTNDPLQQVAIRVIDEGVGMTPEVLDRIRKPYFTTKEGGSGLGVAVARGLIEQHGGHLRFESSPGRGTIATLELPLSALAISQSSNLPNPFRQQAVTLAQDPIT